MLILSLALLLQLRGARVFWIGLLLGFGYVVRPTDAIPLAAAGTWVLLSQPRELPGFLFGALVTLAPFLWYSRTAYQAWLPPYYMPGFYSRNAFKGDALAGLLVSPNRGLLVFSPIFALSLAGVVLEARARRLTVLDLSLAGCVAVHWLVISTTNGNWWGGASYGPRLFTDLVPYLVYFLIPIVAWIASTRGARRRQHRDPRAGRPQSGGGRVECVPDGNRPRPDPRLGLASTTVSCRYHIHACAGSARRSFDNCV
jgi:hypothetical protein